MSRFGGCLEREMATSIASRIWICSPRGARTNQPRMESRMLTG